MMRAAWLGLAFGYATVVAAANDGGPLRDLDWGAVPADNGIAYVPFDFDIGGFPDDSANVAALQPDGKLLIGGIAETGTGTDAALARILSSHGVPDPGFGSGGRRSLGPVNMTGITDLVVLADGRILYSTPLPGSTAAVGRLLADGTPDTTFDFDGRRVFSGSAFLTNGTSLGELRILLQPDGKIVLVSGASRDTPDRQVYAVATRLNTDGSTDATFGGEGTGFGRYAPANGGNHVAIAEAVVRLTNGQFIVGGSAYHNGGSGLDMITFRLSADGELDTSYGADGFGFVAFDLGGALTDILTDLAVDKAGRAVVTGYASTTVVASVSVVARLTASGQLDASFGSGGRVSYMIEADTLHHETGNSVVALPDGRILVAGIAGRVGALTMFATDGTINRFFGVNGTERFGSEFGPSAQILPVAHMLVSGDYAYLTGWARNPLTNDEDFATARVIVPLFRSGFEAAEPAP